MGSLCANSKNRIRKMCKLMSLEYLRELKSFSGKLLRDTISSKHSSLLNNIESQWWVKWVLIQHSGMCNHHKVVIRDWARGPGRCRGDSRCLRKAVSSPVRKLLKVVRAKYNLWLQAIVRMFSVAIWKVYFALLLEPLLHSKARWAGFGRFRHSCQIWMEAFKSPS